MRENWGERPAPSISVALPPIFARTEKPTETLATQASHFRNSYDLFVLHCTGISEENLMLITLRMVPPFVTTHAFCASRDIRIS